ncbi:FPP/GGPP synthase family protein [Aspergillus affinis]|uniref:FPP/GGPP synthase family protein n=1 Tax=Aspergillus affinis TaxID=1070780 RepID=UPI0022FEB512|nr:terpenoid synthase [Aspergillus affinis]KAI9041957.1 terpenoid synthase [Aspergillus affinis]
MLTFMAEGALRMIHEYPMPIFSGAGAAPTIRYRFPEIRGFPSPTHNQTQNRNSQDRNDVGMCSVNGDTEREEKAKETPEEITARYEKIIRGPLDYLLSIPGKDVRGRLISAFNEWLHIPTEKLDIVKEIIELLHTASLLIDDIQDGSRLRRGHPVAHHIFGVPQTINAANYAYFLAQEKLKDLDDPTAAFSIFTRELLNLHRGQGMDLYWRDALVCPSEEEYMQMVSYKTGGLFELAVGLLQVGRDVDADVDFTPLTHHLGTIFQIRDDYLNLQSGLYATKKGAMEDLTEGKFSFPIIHSIRARPENTTLVSILKQRSEDETLKAYAVRYMETTWSFAYCREKLAGLMGEARRVVRELEERLGPCRDLHGILDLLEVPTAEGWGTGGDEERG